ncbi:uncharacterized protein LOC122256376 [Penaeus japonicus]|uniref:uncharacterized protein LOC122256376 n=1 Tax=Penaeus japonicus TaxID=27405 RepID=UPI001C7139ED|nr:uncharacterized protein LOC122256376 [Penaeus japonicus]
MPNHKSASAHAPRRSSADTDSRSATPSQVQVSVQVGTRWDNYASLRDPGTDSQSMHKVPSSSSCPDLEPGTIYNARSRAPSVVECDPRSPPHSAGGAFPLAWSAQIGQASAERGGKTPSPPPLSPSSPTAPCASYPPFLMSRRDSRKIPDLEASAKSKAHVFLKVCSLMI